MREIVYLNVKYQLRDNNKLCQIYVQFNNPIHDTEIKTIARATRPIGHVIWEVSTDEKLWKEFFRG